MEESLTCLRFDFKTTVLNFERMCVCVCVCEGLSFSVPNFPPTLSLTHTHIHTHANYTDLPEWAVRRVPRSNGGDRVTAASHTKIP